MMDLHAHLLPGLDDGPSELSATLDMARAMVEAGIFGVAASPHVFPAMGWTPTRAQILATGETVRHALAAEGIALELLPSAEHFYDESLLARIQAGEAVPINLRRWALVEFSTTALPPDVPAALYRLRRLGIEPLLAHVERYEGLATSEERVRMLVDQGYALQVDMGAIVGQFGKAQQRTAWRLLERDLVTVVASDAHSAADVRATVAAGRELLTKRLGEARCLSVLVERPARICAGEPLDLAC
ncbi:MAG: CpsB/CapC family capsule biosynthesis tyrosine phosphatase [Pseudomonadota bacterium]